MGGLGSGLRWGQSTTTHMRQLDIRHLQREGLLKPGLAFGWNWSRNGETTASINILAGLNRITLDYRYRNHGGEWQSMRYPIEVAWTAMHFGGARPWFLCPAQGCGRRVALLYCDGVFACRRCHQLVYESQRETPIDRASRRANALRTKLGWKLGILHGEGGKPKGMHWRTFVQLRENHDTHASAMLLGIAKHCNIKFSSED